MESIESFIIFIKLLIRDIFSKKITNFDKTQASAHYNLGNKFMETKQLDRAKEEYLKTLSYNPYHVETMVNLGIINYHKSCIEKALEHFKNAYNNDPNNARISYWLGRIYFERENYSNAQKFFKKAIKYKPQFLEANYYLSLVYIKKEMYDFAIEYLRKTLKLDPEWSDAYIHLGKAYYFNKDYPKAVEMLERATQLLGNDTEALLFLGKAYFKTNAIDLALDTVLKALKENINNAEIHYLLSKIYHKQGLTSLAMEEQVKAINLDPKSMLQKISENPSDIASEDIPKFLAISLYIKDLLESFRSYLEEIKIIIKLLSLKKLKLAINQLNNIFVRKNLISFTLLKGNKAFDKSDFKEAEKYFLQVVEIFPEYAPSYIYLSDIYSAQAKPTKAIEFLSKANSYDNNNPYIFFRLGSLYSKINNYSEAIKNFEAVLSFKKIPEHLKTSYYLLSEIYTLTDRLDQATEILKRSKKFNNDAQIYAMLSHRLILKTNDAALIYKSLDLAHKGYEMNQNEQQIWEVIGICHFKLHNYKYAMDWLGKISQPSSEINYYINKIKEEQLKKELETES